MICIPIITEALKRISGHVGEFDADTVMFNLKAAVMFHHEYGCRGDCGPARLAKHILSLTDGLEAS